MRWSRIEGPPFLSASLGLLIAVVASGCSGGGRLAKDESLQDLTPVKTVSVVQETVQRTTTQPATVRSFYRAEIRAKASGYVQQVKADIGDFVEAGATLAVIDVPELAKQREVLEARISKLESEEKRAEAGIQLAEASVRSAEAKLAASKSELNRAEASLAAMEAEFDRTRDLVQRQSLESRMLDEARKKRDSELANKEATASAILSAEAEVAVAKARTAAAKADLQSAHADTDVGRRQLEELDVMASYATLKAPFAGIVAHRDVDPGDLVREGNEVGEGQPLFVISQVDKVRVHIPVPEADAAWVSRGDSITLSFPSFPAEQPIQASVTRLSSDLDPSTRTMLVEAVLPNSERRLIPGMFGQATISLSTPAVASMLPARAIRFSDSGDAFVYIVGDDQTVTVTPVTLGIDDGQFLEVKSGVVQGQKVIDAHLKRFTTGQKVALINAQAS